MNDDATNPAMMRQAIELAMRGRGYVEPNPMVGCVIVKDGRVIGEGFHEKYGAAHAEPNALATCRESPAGATAYVTLEPCCHVEKKTPPCVPRLIEAKIARVIIGCADPNPHVNGRAIMQLRQAGIEVISGILEEECRQLIAPYIAITQFYRPYITLKWAQSADGKITGAGGRPVQIGNETSRRMVHALRGRCDAIVVGINTVLTDDPLLTVRYAEALRTPVRYILDRQLRTPLQSRLLQTARQTSATPIEFPKTAAASPASHSRDVPVAEFREEYRAAISENPRAPTIIATAEAHVNSPKAAELRALGAEIIPAATFPAIIADWQRRRFTHILIEAGPTLARAMMNDNFADRVFIIRSPKIIGEPDAPSAAALPAHFCAVGRANLDGDQWTEYLNRRSDVFFAAVPSADFLELNH